MPFRMCRGMVDLFYDRRHTWAFLRRTSKVSDVYYEILSRSLHIQVARHCEEHIQMATGIFTFTLRCLQVSHLPVCVIVLSAKLT